MKKRYNSLLKTVFKRSILFHLKQEPKAYYFDEQGAVEEFSENPGDYGRKKGFVVKVEEIYKWKNVPVAKVLFHDFQRFANKYRSSSTAQQTMVSFFSVLLFDAMEGIIANQEVSCIIEKTY